jgi:hypothetical protein
MAGFLLFRPDFYFAFEPFLSCAEANPGPATLLVADYSSELEAVSQN